MSKRSVKIIIGVTIYIFPETLNIKAFVSHKQDAGETQ